MVVVGNALLLLAAAGFIAACLPVRMPIEVRAALVALLIVLGVPGGIAVFPPTGHTATELPETVMGVAAFSLVVGVIFWINSVLGFRRMRREWQRDLKARVSSRLYQEFYRRYLDGG